MMDRTKGNKRLNRVKKGGETDDILKGYGSRKREKAMGGTRTRNPEIKSLMR